ncbi:MAG: N-formylglutamate amidohydrolase [Methanomicrobiales archaeon]|nr:N-formylglutamate amidohydrolase [Methanomicrobiales archaeon]
MSPTIGDLKNIEESYNPRSGNNTLKPLLIYVTPETMPRYPFLISIPHGGLIVPEEIGDCIALEPKEIIYYSDPFTRQLFDYRDRAEMVLDSTISRMVIDLNRPPYALPPRHSDGAVKLTTSDRKPVYFSGKDPDITLIHRMMMRYYFPYHARIDQVLQKDSIGIAFDCHSMLPLGPPASRDAGRERPLICLGNNGDRDGKAKKGRLATCSAAWMAALADAFRAECQLGDEVAINDPFSGGFITNAHYWHTGTPFVQIEVNRSLYEPDDLSSYPGMHLPTLRDTIWNALAGFWDGVMEKPIG